MKQKYIITTAIILMLIIIVNTNLLIEPKDNTKTIERKTNFRFIGLAEKVLIDDNKEFTSPQIINKPFVVYLEPKTYYWKTPGFSNTNKFIIDSEIAIGLIEKENKTFKVQNQGNTEISLLFKKLKDWSTTGAAVLQIDESKEIELEDGNRVIALQNE